MLVEKRNSITKRLFDRLPDEEKSTRILRPLFVEGPYGKQDKFNAYKKIVIFTSGIHITKHLMALEILLRGESRHARRKFLHWSVEKLGTSRVDKLINHPLNLCWQNILIGLKNGAIRTLQSLELIR